MSYFPVFLDLKNKVVAVIAGAADNQGEAVRKVNLLLGTDAVIHIFAPDLCEWLQVLSDRRQVHWFSREPAPGDLETCFLVIATSGVKSVSADVFRRVDQALRLVNSADDAANSNFILGSVTQDGPVQVAVVTSGKSPAYGQELRDRFGQILRDERAGELATFLGGWRSRVSQVLSGHALKSYFWHRLLRTPLAESVQQGDFSKADEIVRGILDETIRRSQPSDSSLVKELR